MNESEYAYEAGMTASEYEEMVSILNNKTPGIFERILMFFTKYFQ